MTARSSSEILQLVVTYENMFKQTIEYQTVVTNLQTEILSRMQYTSLPQHFDSFNSQINSNVDLLDCLLRHQTKIIDKLNELSTLLINNANANSPSISSNVYIFGTRNESLDESDSSNNEIPSHTGVENLTFGTIDSPLNSTCPITHETFQQTSQVSRITICGHIFDPSALRRWLRINQTCPT